MNAMIDVPHQGASFLVGSCWNSSYRNALSFAKNVEVPFRVVLSQRLLVTEGAAGGVADLLAGRSVSFPRLRRDVLLFGRSGHVSALADCVRRYGLVDTSRGRRSYRYLWPFHAARVRPVVGHRPPLSAAFFSCERSYDLVLDLVPAWGDAFAWRAGCFMVPGPGLPDNVPFWISCADGALASEDLASVCDSAMVSWV